MPLRKPEPLTLVPSKAPPDRIMNADEIAREKWHGKRSARWVRMHHPGRIEGSRVALWFESVIDQQLAELRSRRRRA